MARSTQAETPAPLGSLTQPGAREGARCQQCSSDRVTRISMELADGSEVDFTNCMECEHRSWQHGEQLLSVDHVLARAQKRR